MDRSVSCHVSEWGGQLLDTSYTDVSRSAVRLRLAGLLPKTWVDVTLPGSLRRWCWWWDEGQTGSLPISQEVGTMWGSVFGTMIGKPISWARTFLLKLALPWSWTPLGFCSLLVVFPNSHKYTFPVSVCWMITVASFCHLVDISLKCTIFKCTQLSKYTCSHLKIQPTIDQKYFLKFQKVQEIKLEFAVCSQLYIYITFTRYLQLFI